jgi:hypothetical protein
VGLNPGFTQKLDGKDGPLDGRKTTKIIKTAKRQVTTKKNIFKKRQILIK